MSATLQLRYFALPSPSSIDLLSARVLSRSRPHSQYPVICSSHLPRTGDSRGFRNSWLVVDMARRVARPQTWWLSEVFRIVFASISAT